VIQPVLAQDRGIASTIDTRGVGLAVVALGGGRTRADQTIDPSVGFTELMGLGADVQPGTPLAMVHARSIADAETAAQALRAAYHLGGAAPVLSQPVLERLA
jgi:thymidine phosphorylase